MEAPEKIYLQEPTKVRTQKMYDNDIEYTRTDVFIEKAVKFMEKIGDTEEYTWYNEEEHAAGITEKCIENFKKYMEDKV